MEDAVFFRKENIPLRPFASGVVGRKASHLVRDPLREKPALFTIQRPQSSNGDIRVIQEWRITIRPRTASVRGSQKLPASAKNPAALVVGEAEHGENLDKGLTCWATVPPRCLV